MNIQKNKSRVFRTALYSLVFVFALSVLTAQTASAQRKFDIRAAGTEEEVKGIALFAQNLVQFLSDAEQIEKKGLASDSEISRLQDNGRRIKDGSSNLRRNLQDFIAKLKAANNWTDEFDSDFINGISNPRVKGFFQRNGGARKLLTDAISAINSVNADVDATVNDAKKPRAMITGNDALFVKASFAASSAKVRVKCVLLGVAIAAAELAKMKLTAENIDNVFDKNCGTGGSNSTT